MKNLHRYHTVIGGTMTALMALWQIASPTPLSATPLYWDLDGTLTNVGPSGTGAWNGLNTFWNTDPTGIGGAVQASTNSADDLFFSAGTEFTSGTITLSFTRLANSLTFEESGIYTLSGGNLTLSGANSLNFSNGTGANVINSALILGASTAFTNSDDSLQTIGGGVSGGFNLTLNANSTGGLTFSASSLNNVGTITNSGTGSGLTTINSTIETNVTGVIQNSLSSALTISGTNTNFASGVTIQAGTVTAATSALALGTGAVILGDVGGGSNAASLRVSTALTMANAIQLASNTTGTLTLGNTGSVNITFSGGVTGTNNFTINSSTGTGTIGFSTAAINNTGTVTHTGTGTGDLTFNNIIGSNVTSVIQNTTSSKMVLNGTGGASAYGNLTIKAGTVELRSNGTTPIISSATITLGDTAANVANVSLNLQGTSATFSNAITLMSGTSGTITIGTLNSGTAVTVSGGITGTNNVRFNNGLGGTPNAQPLNFTTNSINNTGTVSNVTSGGAGGVAISAIIGPNVTGVIQNSATGKLNLSAANTYNGATTITLGTLELSAGASLAGSAVSGASGTTFLISSNSTIGTSGNGSVTIAGGGILSMINNSVNTLTINNALTGATALTMGGGIGNASVWNIELGATADQITLGSGLMASIGAGGVTINLTTLAGLTGTSQTLISASGGGLLSGGGFTLVTGAGNFGGYTLGLNNTGTLLQLTQVANVATAAYWGGSLSSTWNTFTGGNTNNSNWLNAPAGTDTNAAPGATTNVFMTADTASNLSTTLGQNFQINSLTFTGTGTAGTAAVSIGGSPSTLTINATNANGNTAGMGIMKLTGSGASSISAPVILGGNQSWTNQASTLLTVSGGVTGTANLTLKADSTGGVTLSSGSVNNTGTITNSGAGSGTVLISAVIGSNVTSVTQAGTSPFTISSAFALSATNKTLISTGSGLFTLSGSITGTQDLVLNANSTGGITLSGTNVNHVGTITNSGTGAGTATISSIIGANVTGIVQNSLTSQLTLSGGNTAYAGSILIKAGRLQATASINAFGTNFITIGDALTNADATLVGNVGGTISNAIVLASGVTAVLTITSPNVSTQQVFSGGVTGTNNLVVNSTNNMGLRFNGAAVNNTGTVTATGTGAGAITIENLGSNVTSVTQAGSSAFNITSAFALSATNKTLVSTGTGLFTLSGGITGAQNLVLNANSTGGITLSANNINNAGTITNSGTGTGTATLSGGVGANVTAITENSGTSALTISTNLLTVNAAGTTLTNSNSSGSSLLTVSGGVTGTGNLILNNNSAIANGITLSGTSLNNTGNITNSGTGTGGTLISAVIGASVTGLTQNSATSQLTLTNANTYAGATSVTAGTLLLSGASGAINSSSGVSVNGSTARFVQTAATAVSPIVTLTQGTIDGTSTISSVNVANSAGTIITAGNGAAGTLTITTLTYSGASTINLAAAGAIMSTTLATTDLTTHVAGDVTINLTNSGLWSNGTVYNMISYGTLGGNGIDGFVLGTVAGLDPRQSASLGTDTAGPNYITLTIDGDTPVWTGLVSGNWTTGTILSPKNWKLLTGGTETDFLTNDNVLFDDTASITTVNISDANVATSATTFNNSTKNYTLGSVGGFGISAGSLTKSGTGIVTINTVNTYAGATTIDAGTLRLGAVQNLTGALNFGSANNIITAGTLEVKENATFSSLLVQTNSTVNTNNISIDAGKTLTINGNVLIGTGLGGSTTTLLSVSGAGTMTVNNAVLGSTFRVGGYAGSTTAQGNRADANFGGLTALNINLHTGNGLVAVSNNTTINTGGKYSTMTLAATTNITAKTLSVGDGGAYGGSVGQINALRLGSVANNFNVDTFNIGTGQRDFGSVTFNTGTGSIVVRNAAGTGRAVLNIGTTGGGTGVASAGNQNTFDVTGHSADLLLGAVSIGTQATRGDTLSSIFSFDTGTLDMTSLTMSVKTGTPLAGTHNVSSTVNLGGGTVLIGTILQMGQALTADNTALAQLNITGGTVTIGTGSGTAITMASAGTGTTANGSINLTGGTTTITGNIVKTGGAGTTTATITLNGGTLDMNSRTIGAATAGNIITFNAQKGTLKNLAELNGGGVLTKTGAALDTLIMEGSNAYTGGTAINGGILQVNSAGAIGTTGPISFGGGTLQYTVNNQTDYSARFSTAAGQNVRIDTNAQNVTFASALTSSGGTLTKLGTGSLALNNANTYTGGTTISAGTLVTNNTTALGSGNVTVAPGSFLRVGSGISSQELQLNGTLTNNGTIQLDIFSNSGGVNPSTVGDFITFTGVDRLITLTGTMAVNNFNGLGGGNFNPGDSFLLIDWSAITTVSNRNVASLNFDLSSFGGVTFDVTNFQNSGRIVVTSIPEPSRALLLLFGGMTLLFRRRRASLSSGLL